MSIGITAQVHKEININYRYENVSKGNGENLVFFTFDDALRRAPFGALPVYLTKVELPNIYFGADVEIIAKKADTISFDSFQSIINNDLVTSQFETEISYDGSYADIYILPIKRMTESGDIVALTEFTLQIDFVPVKVDKEQDISKRYYADESVLHNGTWVKMGVVNGGVYKITYDDIQDMGIDPSSINTANIGVFGNYSGLLPERNTTFRFDDLQENSVLINDGEDGKFNNGDYILFYAQDPTIWNYSPFTSRFYHTTNIYSDTVYYFFTPDQGTAKQLAYVDGTSYSPTQFCSDYTKFDVHDRELVNLMSSGKSWYGEKFSGDSLTREFTFDIPSLSDKEPVYLNVDLAGRSFQDSYYNIYVNDQLITDSTKIRLITASMGIYARESSSQITCYPDNDKVVVRIEYYSSDESAVAWLDYIELNALCNLTFNGEQMIFCNPHYAASGNITEFSVNETSSNDMVWEITDIHNPRIVKTSFNNNVTSFSLPTDSLLTFIMHNDGDYMTPVSYESVANQNLHAVTDVNLVIVRPEIFAEQAERLADLHREYDDLSVVTVSPEQIYNEFSSGSQDVSAIRDFMKMLYDENAFNGQRAYLMMFGDASFDYKHRIHENTNLVPTFESIESLWETSSFVTDDYFGLLEDNEGYNAEGDVDIGIGRFPVSTVEQATTSVDKVMQYVAKSQSVMREWRRSICFVADDMNNNLHIDQAEGLVSIADTLSPGIAINKIYIDAYKKVKVPGGYRYPEVNTKIDETIDDGLLILNYTGHGGLIGWADEHILDVPMIDSYKNIDNMPLIITATCEFSRFDDPELTSAGEYFFLNENGGAIALLTTTRLAYAHANYIVNRRIYSNLLECEDGEVPRLGDLVRLSKIPSNENYLNFVLLGDPAMTLAYPKYNVITRIDTSTNVNDTVQALTLVKVNGNIVDQNGDIAEDFNGILYPEVLDKASTYTTLGNDPESYPVDFKLFDKSLFDGKVSVNDGAFSFEFMVPKEIAYSYGFGKIGYYALDTINYIDAWGAYGELFVGGLNSDAVVDENGPDIDLYLNDNNFVSGDVVISNSVMFAMISDESGVNHTGAGIGRDIVMIMDKNSANPYILNGYYESDIDSYQSGKIIYPVSNLKEGYHTLTLKAWDIQNNSSEKTIEFVVDDDASIKMFDVKAKPNPFIDNTVFTFRHNKGGSHFQTTIRIFDSEGNYITEISTGEEYVDSGSVFWDGMNANGSVVAPGLYVYTIEVTDNFGNTSVQQQKIFKINR